MISNFQAECILIVTVTKVEAQAVLNTFAPNNTWVRQPINKKTYFDLGVHGGVPVFMVQSEMGAVTPGGSLLTVRQAIHDLQPQAVIMCGIAFGLRSEKQNMGDILISKQLLSYEPQKIDLRGGQIPRGDRVTASDRLLDRFRSGDLDWQGAKTHFGLVFSGEKLINDPEFRKSLLDFEPEAIGGEMEGAGLYVAARDAGLDWILVKAICDWADGTKSDNTQPIAAMNAAEFLLHVIECGDWKRPVSNRGIKTTKDIDSNENSKKAELDHGVIQPSESSSQYLVDFLIKEMIRSDASCQEAMFRIREMEPEVTGNLHHTLRQKLLYVMKESAYEVRERFLAGNTLSELEDPRFRSDAWFLPNEDLLGFIEVPAGSFLMGTETDKKGSIIPRESPQHVIKLPRYYISHYPVTLAQYLSFQKERPSRRQIVDLKYLALGNHPAVGITWHDALHYCEWLTERLRGWPDTPQPIADLINRHVDDQVWIVTLPSEAEWEKAARGENDSRDYPWGLHESPNLANYRANGLDTTSPVGCFEGGRSPYGIFDLSGNVWEWTRNNWGMNLDRPQYKYPYIAQDGRENFQVPENMLKVIRGGSFNSSSDEIRCSFRGAALPDTKQGHIGFRLVITQLSRP